MSINFRTFGIHPLITLAVIFLLAFHIISDKPFTKGTFTVVFDGAVPDWVNDCNDMDDSTLDSSNSHKTYGFKYMCEGIHAGFHANNTSNITARYDFEIK